MEEKYLIRNAVCVNEGRTFTADVAVSNGMISDIITDEKPTLEYAASNGYTEIDAGDMLLFPGVIDDQVHFREPGLTHKDDIASGSLAAVAGGITSFMDMPNTLPPTTTIELLEEKYELAKKSSFANYGFFLGATNHNAEEIKACPPDITPGIKVFLGASTGNLLVDYEQALDTIFSSRHLIAVHSEDETIIRARLDNYKKLYGDSIHAGMHPHIRPAEACVASTIKAINRAKKLNTRLHVLHLSTAEEAFMFDQGHYNENKRITAEVCIHHLWFCDEDYQRLGNMIKWNPAIKTANDRAGLISAVKEGRIDMIATDHAPHTHEEKLKPYTDAPSGGPMVQHALPVMLELCHRGIFTYELVAEKMCHAPARCFGLSKRGMLRKGFYADLVLVKKGQNFTIDKKNILYKCGWSPLGGSKLHHSVDKTFVNGVLTYDNGKICAAASGQRLNFHQSN